ncbi:hypothetical protein MF621_004140 (plasmid) [Bacillus velezensis]|uniref:hypothetical protein n=1 Tax=Bacillus velezensis TaxID=492670 RepID=UPI002024BEF3|nr:hypothetical protein [Bacillus velezensis]URJ76433.1 hypothetical protein MF619_004006 [Bacillus velezensis]URJ80389.1 hypothetical protein MF621_004140 [Bacillus velezensis]
MIDIKPTLYVIEPWDALKGTSVYYSYTGSKQSLDNELVITDILSNEIVYKYEFSSFEKVHHIPPSLLTNGSQYKAKIRVKMIDGTYSPYSNEVSFKTFSTPVLDIDNIDGQGYVYNSDVTFIALYSQGDGELVKSYRFSLYDENEDLIKNFPIRTPSSQEALTEVVKGLEKGKGYFIECSIETINGVTYSHKERFIPLYIVPSINGVISTRNDSDEGFIRVTANLKQITGTQVQSSPKSLINNENNSLEQIKDNYKYIDNEWIVIPREDPVVFRGLGMNRASDFITKVWCRNIPDFKEFLEIRPVEGEGIPIKFYKYPNKIVAEKNIGDIQSRYISNLVSIPKDVDFMLYVQVIEHRIYLEIKIL